MNELVAFAAEVGAAGPVACVGGRTQWSCGGSVASGTREVTAPSGVVSFVPADMTVRVRAGTPVTELQDVVAAAGQLVTLPEHPQATVGGVLAVGQSDLRRLGRGPVRDTVLEIRYVSAGGRLVKAGGPTVKNVSGFDLCRLLVGSLGTLGFLAEVVLRTRPRPAISCWYTGEADPFALREELYRPASVLWDGRTTWVLLEGHEADVEAEGSRLDRAGLGRTGGPPPVPAYRESVDPARLARLEGDFLAEVGVGVVHRPQPVAAGAPDPGLVALQQQVKRRFDPAGRLNPGREVLG